MQTTRSAVIRLTDVFPKSAILIGIKQRTREAVIQEMIHRLVGMGHLCPENEQAVVDQVMARETMGTTALGNSIAVPNCFCGLTDDFLGVVGINSEGIDFNAVDGELVRSVFLIVAPPNRREEHFDLLGRVTAIGRDKSLRTQLYGCRTAEALHHFLEEFDRDAEMTPRLSKGRRLL